MAQSGKKNRTSHARFDLNDVRVVYTFFFHSVELMIDTAEQAMQNRLSAQEVTTRFLNLMDSLVGIFLGKDSEYIPIEGWNGPALGRSLRCTLAIPLMALSDKDRELFSDDESVVVYAVNTFVKEVQDFIGQLAEHDLEMTEDDARDYHDLCLKWTLRFMPPGTKFENT